MTILGELFFYKADGDFMRYRDSLDILCVFFFFWWGGLRCADVFRRQSSGSCTHVHQLILEKSHTQQIKCSIQIMSFKRFSMHQRLGLHLH